LAEIHIYFHAIEEFLNYFKYVTTLEFEETPNYGMLKNLFKQLFLKNKFTYDNILYDWEIIYAQRQGLRN
jgi:hypothetical protein